MSAKCFLIPRILILVPIIAFINGNPTSSSQLDQNASSGSNDRLDVRLLMLQLTELVSRDNELTSKVADLISSTARLEEKVAGLERDRLRIDERMKNHDRQVTVLTRNTQRQVKESKREVSSVKSRNKILQRLVKEQKNDISYLKEENMDLKEQLKESGQLVERYRLLGEKVVDHEDKGVHGGFYDVIRKSDSEISAFSVAREFDQSGNSSHFVVITYDKVDINTGEMNPETGVFTCRIPGLYQFFFSVCVTAGGRAFVRLVRNETWETGLYSELGELVQSQGILMALTSNDTVHLELGMNDAFGVCGNRFTVFHGHLLYRA
ncbi:uncharacterized protein [Ptychodera flava]|uniref:uncharacterized protein n=1 Tax=Ptychodera flava TaxID=63121 RepID=UPI003969CFB6